MAKCESAEELSSSENYRLASFTYASNRNFESIYFQYQQGMLSSDQWHGFRSNLKALLTRKNGAMTRFWNPDNYSDAYRNLVAEIRAEIENDA